MKMTALERAKKNNQPPELKPCRECENSERVGEGLFCKVNGKLILPRFEELCLCRGKLKGKGVK